MCAERSSTRCSEELREGANASEPCDPRVLRVRLSQALEGGLRTPVVRPLVGSRPDLRILRGEGVDAFAHLSVNPPRSSPNEFPRENQRGLRGCWADERPRSGKLRAGLEEGFDFPGRQVPLLDGHDFDDLGLAVQKARPLVAFRLEAHRRKPGREPLGLARSHKQIEVPAVRWQRSKNEYAALHRCVQLDDQRSDARLLTFRRNGRLPRPQQSPPLKSVMESSAAVKTVIEKQISESYDGVEGAGAGRTAW
jgi:hypothetical protein